jgi:predicted GH43/DUF377 family glycosyl hydrolase
MITVIKQGIILERTENYFENQGVSNPAVFQQGETLHMLYRAIQTGNYSSIGYCRLQGPLQVVKRNCVPLLKPGTIEESHGIEDPRIVNIGRLYYLTFTSYNGITALGSLSTSNDLVHFHRKGIIVPKISFHTFKLLSASRGGLNAKYEYYHNSRSGSTSFEKMPIWDKDVVFFPRKINNRFYFLHRIRPDIQIVSVSSIGELTRKFWRNYLLNFDRNILMRPKFAHEISYIGAGAPPIETKEGWLLIYHGVSSSGKGYIYCACAALLDLGDPFREIARLPYALITPDLDHELKGTVNNVVFPTGTSLFGDKLYIYYGAADSCIGCASVSLNELLEELLRHKGSSIGECLIFNKPKGTGQSSRIEYTPI